MSLLRLQRQWEAASKELASKGAKLVSVARREVCLENYKKKF
ncbi:hypothetical protein AB1K18_16395 [Peribacillus simplex]